MNQKLIRKFIAGKCSPEELNIVMRWYYSEEALAEFGDKINELWNQKYQTDSQFRKQLVFQRINRKIYSDQNQIINTNNNRNYQNLKNRINWGWAAVISMILLSGLAFWFHNQWKSGPISVPIVENIIKSTTKGQKSTFFLPDGTKVKMNSASSLTFPERFEGPVRKIFLTGEAFFEVNRDTLKPFIVITEQVATKALGTSFNINSYADQQTVKVALVSGSVEVTNNNGHLILSPGEMAISYNNDSALSKKSYNASILAWRHDKIYFENANWQEVIHKLEMWYGVNFTIKNQKYNVDKLYNGEFKSLSLDLVLENMSFNKNFEYSIDGKEVLIEFKP